MAPPARRPRRGRPWLRYALCALIAHTLLTGAEARAQLANPAAQALYDQATTEMDAGQYESACKKLEEVVRLVPDGLGAKMTLAQCYEGMGRLASAWSQYGQVESLAAKSNQQARRKKAAARAAALKGKLATLTIDVPADARVPGLEISRDGEIVGEAQWGVALPVDRGAHAVTARAPGRDAWSGSVDVPADGKKVSITVPMLAPEVKPAPTATATAEPARPPPPPPAPPVKTRTWQTPLGIATLAVGAAGLAAGGAFGGLALVRFDESKAAGCDASNQCPPQAAALRNEARLFGDVSTAALVAGGALAATGLVLILTAPSGPRKDAPPAGAAGLSVEIAPLFGGAQVRGAF